MKNFLFKWCVAFIVFIVFDFLWLGFIAQNIYKANIGFLMTPTPIWSAAIIFYVLFILGLVFFVLPNEELKKGWKNILIRGAFFGLVTYATFDLTAQALILGWPWIITLIDLAWGTILSSIVSLVTYLIFIPLPIKKHG